MDEISAIARVHVQPGDTLVLHTEAMLSAASLERLGQSLKKHFPTVPILILDGGTRLSVISDGAGDCHQREGSSDGAR